MTDQSAHDAEPVRIAVVGLGKIAHDQHLPSIAATPGCRLAATVDPRGAGVAGAPTFASLDALLAHGPAVDAVAICTPPQVRGRLALQALDAGLDCLLEKPPAADLAEAAALRAAADRRGASLYATWHTRFAPGVAPARAWLAGRRIERVALRWREDVRVWHPGQDWIWDAGGMGVFDPGLNGFAILTGILPRAWTAVDAELDRPADCRTPIAVRLRLSDGAVEADCDLDWREEGEPVWSVAVDTADGPLALDAGGTRLVIADREVPLPVPSKTDEYEAIYARFRDLVRADASDFDLQPMRIVVDAMRIGTERVVAPFGRPSRPAG